MGKFIGTLLFLVGLSLLTLALFISPLLLPQTTGQVIWRSALGFFLCVAGYVMASYSGAEGLLKFFAFLLGMLGLGLLTFGLFPSLFGHPLYPGAGNTVRWIVGVLFCISAWGLWELGRIE
ncbi:MAG: hypothetical protein ACP5UM_06585 [Anaerolineae bacterium]